MRILDERGHLRTLEDIERDLIQLAIEIYAGHMSEVARRLGIGRSTLYRKVREQGLDVGVGRGGLEPRVVAPADLAAVIRSTVSNPAAGGVSRAVKLNLQETRAPRRSQRRTGHTGA